MTGAVRRLLPAAVLLAAAAGARAAHPGFEGLLFGRLGGDARTAALGPAAETLAEADGALYGNPAGALSYAGTSFASTFLQWPGSFNGASVAFLSAPAHGAALGLGGFLFWHDAVPVTTEILPNGTGALAPDYNLDVAALAAQPLWSGWSVGVALRMQDAVLGDAKTAAAMADVGLTYELTPEWFLGADVRGLGKELEGPVAADPVPLTLDVAARYAPADQPVRAYAGVAASGYGPNAGGVGIEGGPWGGARVRAMAALREGGTFAYGGGVGWTADLWDLGFALSSVAPLGYEGRLTLALRFASRPRP